MIRTAALVMAAGSGDRFGGDEPKQFSLLYGRPVLVWSVEKFSEHDAIAEIIIVGPPGSEQQVERIVEPYKIAKLSGVVAGGNTRQQSVRHGLEFVKDRSEFVIVHDAVRPCFSRDLLNRLLEALKKHKAVVPTVPAVDTLIHQSDEELDAVLDRAHIMRVQTPQGFQTGLLLRAHKAAEASGFTFNDDGTLVYHVGAPVMTIPGESANVKITYREDVKFAESIISAAG